MEELFKTISVLFCLFVLCAKNGLPESGAELCVTSFTTADTDDGSGRNLPVTEQPKHSRNEFASCDVTRCTKNQDAGLAGECGSGHRKLFHGGDILEQTCSGSRLQECNSVAQTGLGEPREAQCIIATDLAHDDAVLVTWCSPCGWLSAR